MELANVLPLLVEHVRLADVFRMREAVCERGPVAPDVVRVLATRMQVARAWSLDGLARRMQAGRRHCRECGIPTRRKVMVCGECGDSTDAFFALRGREYARTCNRTRVPRVRNLEARLRYDVAVVACLRSGAFVYWKADLDLLLRSG